MSHGLQEIIYSIFRCRLFVKTWNLRVDASKTMTFPWIDEIQNFHHFRIFHEAWNKIKYKSNEHADYWYLLNTTLEVCSLCYDTGDRNCFLSKPLSSLRRMFSFCSTKSVEMSLWICMELNLLNMNVRNSAMRKKYPLLHWEPSKMMGIVVQINGNGSKSLVGHWTHNIWLKSNKQLTPQLKIENSESPASEDVESLAGV